MRPSSDTEVNRLDAAPNPARGHRGLGLHVAAQAAARHCGSVELANREDADGGACVTLRFPLG